MFDAMQGVTLHGTPIVHAVIQNCFVNHGFGTESSVTANYGESCDWVELGHNFLSTFNEFLNVNTSV